MYSIETSRGSITLAKNVIGRIVIETVDKYKGKIIISNHKGKKQAPAQKAGNAEAISAMDISMGEKGLDLRIYVVMHFGMSIGSVTSDIIEGIHERIRELMGIEPNSIAIVVTGMISKQQMAKRNIEVTSNGLKRKSDGDKGDRGEKGGAAQETEH